MVEDTLIVIQTVNGGPSEKVGILAGDRIIAVNDTAIAGVKMSRSEIMRRLRGKKGTKVNVAVKRAGEAKPIVFTVTRDRIPVTSLDAAYLIEPGIGYVKLGSFGATTFREMVHAIDSLRQRNSALSPSRKFNLILDLQDNGGGYLSAAVEVANEFLAEDDLIVYTEGRKVPRRDMNANGYGKTQKGHIVVLVNEYTASAAEIVSGAIQDHDRGYIVGRRTFGKGLVQRPVELPDGSMIRLTVAHYYTPTGRCIQKPYKPGDKAGYDMDFEQRMKHGELTCRDSIHFADSLKFNTLKKQRTVYGGGGIMPDYFISLDTTKYTKYHRDLARKGTIIQTTLRYLDDKRAEMKQKYPTFDDYRKKFEVDEDILGRLRKQGERDSVKLKDEAEYKKSLPQIRRQIKALLARDLWNMNEYFQIFNEEDDAVQKALELVKERNTDALLMKKKR
jgi:carboxyl-terminal processing protease